VLRFVQVRVTSLTIEMHDALGLDGLVLDERMAVEALDLVLRDVDAVEELRVPEFLKPRLLPVAGEAAFVFDCPIPSDHHAMALRARHRKPLNARMRGGVLAAGPEVAEQAFVLALGALFLAERPSGAHVAEHTRRGGDHHVFPLHDLRMTGGAAQLLSPARTFQVRRVLKLHAEEHHHGRVGHDVHFVAARAQARSVLNFGPRTRAFVGLGEVGGHLIEAAQFAVNGALDAGRIVADDALDILVRRGPPGLVKRLHVMARGAKRRAGRALCGKHRQKRQPDRYCPCPKPPALPPASGTLRCGLHTTPLMLYSGVPTR